MLSTVLWHPNQGTDLAENLSSIKTVGWESYASAEWVLFACTASCVATKQTRCCHRSEQSKGCCSCRACCLLFPDENAVVFAVGRRIICGFGGCLAGKSNRYSLSSTGDCSFCAKTVGCCLSVLQVTFAGFAISKITV